MTIAQRVDNVRQEICRAAALANRPHEEITLCAVTKTQSPQAILQAVQAGVSVCGENRVQELTANLAAGAYGDAKVHFIGHLQTNKVNKVVGKVDLIQSVDSLRLAQEIERQAEKLSITQDILLQVNIAQEESKGGIPPDALSDLLAAVCTMPHIRVRGLMAIPPISQKQGDNAPYFSRMHKLFVDMQKKMSDNQNDVIYLSLGMSGDFPDAIAHGSTMVRVGSALFGPRAPH